MEVDNGDKMMWDVWMGFSDQQKGVIAGGILSTKGQQGAAGKAVGGILKLQQPSFHPWWWWPGM